MESQPFVNYFTVLNLPVSITLSFEQLDKAFYQLQLQYHPDLFAHLSVAHKQEATAKAALINTAYYTLRNFITRVEHLLAIHNVVIEQLIPSNQLMLEVLEWREEQKWSKELMLEHQQQIEKQTIDYWHKHDMQNVTHSYLRLKFFNRFMAEQ